MDLSQQKAQFSIAYTHAVATIAGYKLYGQSVDDESVDVGVAQTGGDGTVRSPRLELQLKCTERDILKDDGIHFPLKRKNYDDLRDRNVMIPKILVVMLVPDDLSMWLTEVPERQICLHRYAWWMNLAGADERSGVETPTVILPRTQLFNPSALKAMMEKIGRRESL
jgi:hypothetical protein